MLLLKSFYNLLIRICVVIILMVSVTFSFSVFANDGPSPDGTVNTFTITMDMAEHLFDYMHWKMTGICVWWHCDAPWDCGLQFKPELDQYLPDLIISSYNGNGNDPLWEASQFPTKDWSMDSKAHEAGNELFKDGAQIQYGFKPSVDLENGNTSSITKIHHGNAIKTKSTDVIGAPFWVFGFPDFVLQRNTTPYMPYYQSDMDTMGKLGLAEVSRTAYIINPLGYYIGSSPLNHWGYEFPRDMTTDVYNDYKASVITALRAVDIVTNYHTLHTAQGTSNSCGDNCVVSNIIEEQSDKNEIWEEVYPHDKHIQLGESDAANPNSLGQDDEQKGHGNYVFLIWRHYRGCVQGRGRIIYKSSDVGEPVKR